MKIFLPLLLGTIAIAQHGGDHMWKTVFDLIDRNHDGTFSTAEFHSLVPGFDINHDGHISQAEFITTWDGPAMNTTHDMTKHEAAGKTLFNLVDKDKSGDWSFSEVQNLLPVFDLNSDGSVSEQEFHTEWNTLHA